VAVPLSPPQAQEHDGKIEVKYDGFSYETVIALKKMSITCRGAKGLQNTMKDTCVSIAASLHGPGKQLEFVRYARLQLIFETKDWDRRHNLGERDLVAVADNETVKLGTMQLVTQAVDSVRQHEVMKEVLEVSMPYQTFEKLAKADVLEMKVGKTMFELREKNMLALRDLNNRVMKN
jgi:hypothetical protein